MDRFRLLLRLALALVVAGLLGQNQAILAAPTAITVAITSPTSGQVVTTGSVTFTGTSSPGSTLSLSIDGGAAIPVTADAAGNWSYTATLPDGPHTATINGVRETTPLLWMSIIQPSSAPDQVAVADPTNGSVIRRITLSGDGVEGIALNGDRTKLYACHGLGVDVISTSTYAILTTIPLPSGSQLCTLNPSATELWVTQPATDRIAVINTTTDTVSTYVTLPNNGAPHDVQFSPDGQFAYTSNTEAENSPSTVTKINATTKAVVTQVGAGLANRYLVVSPDGSRLYVTGKNSSRVFVFNTATMTQIAVITISSFNDTEDIVFSPDGSRLYVSQQVTSNVVVINPATNALVPSEQLSSPNLVPVINAITTHRMFPTLVFVGNQDDVDVFDTTTRALVPAQHIQHTANGTGTRTYAFAWQDRFDTATDSVSFTVNTTADLSIVKSHTGNFIVGQQGTYSLVVSNAGPATAVAPIQVTDTLPAGLTFVSGSGTGWSCSAVGQNVTCTRSTDLAAGATAPTISLLVDVGPAAAPSVVNRACVSSGTGDPDTSDDCDDDTTTVLVPALVIQKQANPASGTTVAANNLITYTLEVQNTGTAPLTGVVITDAIPLATEYVVGSAIPGPASGPDPLVWSIGNLAVGGQASVSFTVRVLPIGTTVAITNTAHTASNETSPVESNEVLHPFDPTAITMLGMSATPESGGIRVAWTTGSEAGTLGFQVFRASSQERSAAVQVTTALLPSQGAAGGDYSFLDATAPATGRFYYWIVELETNGTTTHDYGPVSAARGYTVFMPMLQR